MLPASSKDYSAEILDGGMRATYRMPLLGTEWTCRYEVAPDRDRIESLLACAWAEATQSMARVPDPSRIA